MDPQLQEEIIALVKKELESSGNCSIKQAAEKVFCPNISMADQRKLAKLIVQGSPLISETQHGEIIIKKNLEYSGHKSDGIPFPYKVIGWAVVGILSYLVFEVLLPNLN